MKQIRSILLLTALVSIAACKKDTVNSQLQHDLAGTWELSKAYVYMNVNGGVIDYAPGNGNVIVFSNSGQLSETAVNDDTTYTVTRTYSLQKKDNCGINLLIQEGSITEPNKYHIAVHSDSLIMSAGSCIADAGSYIYLRQ